MNCKYYVKEEPKESRCRTDSTVGYCIDEYYPYKCPIRKELRPLRGGRHE